MIQDSLPASLSIFTAGLTINLHLAPPLFARKNPKTGLPRKSEFGPWMFSVFKILARCKGLRGSRFDPFGWTTERRMERRLRDQYFSDMERLCKDLTSDNHSVAVELAEAPEQIRGFGHVKLAAAEGA